MASAQVIFYQALKAKIDALVDSNNKQLIPTCRLWNNQLPYNKDEESFKFPAVFIEFAQLNVINLQAGVQTYDTLMRFHFGFENYMLEDLTMFDVKDAVDQAICNTKPGLSEVNNGIPGWIPLNKTMEQHDSNDSSVYCYIMEYVNRLIDMNTSSLPPLIPILTDLELDVTPEIVPVIT